MGDPTQDTWLKELGVNVEASRAAAGRASTAPSLNVSARSGQGPKAPYTYQSAEASAAKPGTQYREYEEPSDEAKPAAPSLNVSTRPAQSTPPTLNVSAQPGQGPKAPYTYQAAEASAAKPASSTKYKPFEEPSEEAESAKEPSDDATPSAPPSWGDSLSGYSDMGKFAKNDDSPATAYASDDDDDDNPDADAADEAGDDAIEPAGSKPVETGMKTKRVGDQYEGEHNKLGWRSKIAANQENTRMTTKLYSEEEQAANRLVQQPDGKFKKGGIEATDNQSMGFVMDEAGRMVAFKDSVAKVNPDGTREETKDPYGELSKGARIETTHHSSALGGEAMLDEQGKPVLDAEGRPMMRSKPAALAGEISFNDDGKIETISNVSGHYKPTVDYLLQGVEYLMKQGAFFKDEIVRMTDDVAEGEKYKPLKSSDPDFRAYKLVQERLEQSKTLAAQVRKLTGDLEKAEGKSDQKAVEKIGGQLEALKSEVASLKAIVDETQQRLRKAGVGPSNRLREDAQAAFIKMKPDMTGAQVHQTQTTTMGVGEFTRTGGGNKDQADRKTAALEELKEKEAKGGEGLQKRRQQAVDAVELEREGRFEEQRGKALHAERRNAMADRLEQTGRKAAMLDELKQNPPKLKPKGGK